MARGVNKVILVGNLGNDPDTRYTQSGMAVTRISLATTSVRKDRDGNSQERTEWHRVVFFGKLGEIANQYLRKGQQVYIEGSIRYDKYTGKDGTEKYSTDIVADEMQMLGSRGEQGGHEGSNQNYERPQRSSSSSSSANSSNRRPAPNNTDTRQNAPNAAPAAAPMDDFADDDVPF